MCGGWRGLALLLLTTPTHAQSAEKLGLDGVIVIGGDDSNTNAAVQYCTRRVFREGEGAVVKEKVPTRVIGCVQGGRVRCGSRLRAADSCPKTIDGDLKNQYIPVSFGFDTACKTYAEMIGNVAFDALSSRKYYHFIRLMGRAASNITLEAALQTQPNVTLIGEEVMTRKQDLASVTKVGARTRCACPPP